MSGRACRHHYLCISLRCRTLSFDHMWHCCCCDVASHHRVCDSCWKYYKNAFIVNDWVQFVVDTRLTGTAAVAVAATARLLANVYAVVRYESRASVILTYSSNHSTQRQPVVSRLSFQFYLSLRTVKIYLDIGSHYLLGVTL